MPFDDLERQIDRELSRLASPPAPRTLLPRVLRAAEARQRDSFGAWFTWPLVWQASSLALMALLVAGLMNVSWLAAWMFAVLSPGAASEWPRAADVVRQAVDIAGAAAVVWRVLMEPVAIVLVLFLATMFAASAALGAALRNVVLGGASRP
ncbi:MAG TPA: hypothetical protein VF424_11050 [Vicinamibacterales bacterium]